MCKQLIALILAWCFGASATAAETAVEGILPMDGRIAADGRSIELNWFDANPPRVGSVTIKRRIYGQTGGQSWKAITPALGPVMRYTDLSVRPGVAYEYQVLRSARDIIDVGYWLAGTDLPARAERGNAYMVVDETIAEAISPRLARFERDLTGDGWRVLRRTVPRWDNSASVANLKAAEAIRLWLQSHYSADPFGQHSVILIGHVPVLHSGQANPDGHRVEAHATDLFYADMDGQWNANFDGVLLHNSLPSDFIEMQIGRIDFANMAGGNRDLENRLLQAYFDKNHHWRMGMHGDLRQAYGGDGNLLVESYALRNIVGPAATVIGGHHDIGEAQPWLWGVHFGDYDGSNYSEKYANKAVFAINFGSGKQKFERPFNAMTALLAQPFYTVAVGWGGRPAWWLHPMALGGSIGEVHLRTVNNGMINRPYRDSMDYYPTGKYLWRNPIWVVLLGDPTLRAFPLAPASQVKTQPTDVGVSLSWQPSPDPDTLGYRVFRVAPESSVLELLTDASSLVSGTSFIDSNPIPDALYMVRAYGLKNVYAGSFRTYAQSAFALPNPILMPEITLQTPVGQSLRLPDSFNEVTDGLIHAFIAPPARGRLVRKETGWIYVPPAGFSGAVEVRFSVSDSLRTAEGKLTIVIGS